MKRTSFLGIAILVVFVGSIVRYFVAVFDSMIPLIIETGFRRYLVE